MTITGTDLTGATAVDFGGAAGTAAGSGVRLVDTKQEFLDRAIAGVAAFLDKGIAKGILKLAYGRLG